MNMVFFLIFSNLTAARHTLIVDEYQTLQTEFSEEPDVICLEDDDNNSPLTVRIKYGVKVHKFKLKRVSKLIHCNMY